MASNENNLKIDWGTILSGVILLSIAIIALSIFTFFFLRNGKASNANKSEQVDLQMNLTKEKIEEGKNTVKEKIKEEELHFNQYSNYNQVSIYPEGLYTPSAINQYCLIGSTDQSKCDHEIIRLIKTISVTPPLSDAYLYVKAAVSRGNDPFGPLTSNDSIYFFLDDAQKYGGHLLRYQAVWSRENKDSTELLFDLNSIPFTTVPYPSTNSVTPIKSPNLLEVLNQEGEHYLVSFVSTLGAGKIIEMKIGYEEGLIEVSN